MNHLLEITKTSFASLTHGEIGCILVFAFFCWVLIYKMAQDAKSGRSWRVAGEPIPQQYTAAINHVPTGTVKAVINTGSGFNLSTEALKRCIAENAIGIDSDWPEVTDPITEFPIDVGDGYRQDLFAIMLYRDGKSYTFNCSKTESRSDPILVKIVEEMGDAASVEHSTLKIIEVPSDVSWHIFEDEDGTEYVRENSRMWGAKS